MEEEDEYGGFDECEDGVVVELFEEVLLEVGVGVEIFGDFVVFLVVVVEFEDWDGVSDWE